MFGSWWWRERLKVTVVLHWDAWHTFATGNTGHKDTHAHTRPSFFVLRPHLLCSPAWGDCGLQQRGIKNNIWSICLRTGLPQSHYPYQPLQSVCVRVCVCVRNHEEHWYHLYTKSVKTITLKTGFHLNIIINIHMLIEIAWLANKKPQGVWRYIEHVLSVCLWAGEDISSNLCSMSDTFCKQSKKKKDLSMWACIFTHALSLIPVDIQNKWPAKFPIPLPNNTIIEQYILPKGGHKTILSRNVVKRLNQSLHLAITQADSPRYALSPS